MKNLLNQFLEIYHSNDEFQRQVGNYERVLKTEDWKFLVTALHIIKGQMALDMFSKHHTMLDEVEKDVIQRTYFNINQMLNFLLTPRDWVRKKSKWKESLTQLKGKVTPNRREGN